MGLRVYCLVCVGVFVCACGVSFVCALVVCVRGGGCVFICVCGRLFVDLLACACVCAFVN